MIKKILETITGTIEDKKEYKLYKKRIKKLPKEYKNAMIGIETYMWRFSLDATNELYDILEMFEISVADGRKVEDVIGNDIGVFCDNIMKELPEKTWIEGYKKKVSKQVNKNINK